MSVLLIACSAVLAGARSVAAIGQWARKAPQEALTRLGARSTSVFAIRVAPSTATVRRIINATCPGAAGSGTPPPRACRPARRRPCQVRPPGRGRQLRSRLAQRRQPGRPPTGRDDWCRDGRHPAAGPDKVNAITCFAALHTRRAHAHFLVGQKDAHYAFTVKKNQPILYAQLKNLPWDKATAKFYRSHGHGQLETWLVQVLTVTALGIDFRTPRRARRPSGTGPA
ncbi:hypothetical protein [Streptomyces sp. NPDC059122]|uniref:hypothetical protein n=1 Tax=Streptomyces sp. NPDC059122 TaxID=3346732 RepID=UPI0036AA9B44